MTLQSSSAFSARHASLSAEFRNFRLKHSCMWPEVYKQLFFRPCVHRYVFISQFTTLPAGGGYFFGNLPFVKHNFTLVVLGIIVVSIVPVVIELINARKEQAQANDGKAA